MLLPCLPYLVHCKPVYLQISISVDVQPGESLEVWNPEGREGFVIVHMEPVDRNVEVAAKQEAHCWCGQDPIVGKHAHVVRSCLHASHITWVQAAGLTGITRGHV